MTTSSVRIVPLLVLLATSLSAVRAHGLTPAPDLPPGSFHELRITSLTALTVAQQITQAAICSNPNVCLHNEVRVGASINFDTGVIAIDARAPEDENGTPVLPTLPGGILFNTLSGPVELTFGEPCISPDGCPFGEPLYIGTIDQGGNVSFPSIGLNFNLFGVSPVSRFRGPMGTGSSTDPADPGVVAAGAPLDFATGAIDLAGIDFIPAPIVGTTLQLDHIRGRLVPVPIPPVETDDLLACQSAIQKAGASFVRTKQAALQKCVSSLLSCEVEAEASGIPAAACIAKAQDVCDRMEVRAIRAEQALSRQIVTGCKKVGPANIVAIEGGLGMSLVKPQCDRLGIGTSTREDLALCLGRALSCSTEEVVGRLEPRAYEVLATHGHPEAVVPQGCVPQFAPGDATGFVGSDVLECQTAIEKQGAKFVKIKQTELQACMVANLACHLEFELDTPGTLDPDCVAKAATRCNRAVAKIASAETKQTQGIQKGCLGVDVAGIPALLQGLGFTNLVEHCQSLDTPVTLNDVDGVIDCLGESVACSIEGVARSMIPRGHEVLHHHGLNDVITQNHCLHPECGDGLLDPGEACDLLFDPDQTCNPDCTLVVCGDGQQQGTEECDDGNTLANDGCSATCEDEPFACGNGVIEPFAGEVCDDSDSAGGDGCSANCKSSETCGNGVVDTLRGETCDDGGTSYVATLSGASETPPVVTAATGSATVTLNPDDSLTYSVTSTGLSATVAHIHVGAVGVAGPILFPLAGGPTAWAGTTSALTAEQKAQLESGLLYVNVHTVANIAGEIRGQIGFAAPLDGDGCSASCRSNESCGNGVVDAVTGETCDDGNLLSGDGCDASCALEACSFVSTGALGTRSFSVDPAGSALFNSILGLGFQLGAVSASAPLSLTAGPTDAGGNAAVTLDADVIISIDVALGNQTQCLKLEAATTTGSLHCCGGRATGMSNTRDSNTGGIPATGGQANGPAIQLSGVGSGVIGDLVMAFGVRQSGGALGFDCATGTYGGVSTQIWTTGTATGRVLRPLQGGPMFEFGLTGEPFSCGAWTTEDGPGKLVSADTALNATPGTDGANVRRLDD